MKIISTVLGSLVLMFYYSCKITKPIIDNKPNENTPTEILKDSGRLASYNGDTIGYINYIYKNQIKYIGKPLSELLNDLDFKINQFNYVGPHKRDGKIYSVILQANPYGQNGPLDASKINQNMVLGVGLQTFVLQDSIKEITAANGTPNYFNWSKKAETYFSKQIV
ncbi:MAG: hypothetical protein ABL929_11040, partial [Ferruginibacter sp.]